MIITLMKQQSVRYACLLFNGGRRRGREVERGEERKESERGREEV